jgi:hypothetical protein
MNPEQYQDFKHRSIHNLMALNRLCEQEFGTGKWERWD